MRWAVFASVLLGACYPVEGNECDPGPFWDGPYLENPGAASTGDRMLVVWREVDIGDGVVTGTYRGAPTDGTTSDAPFDYEPGLAPRAMLSGSDRALVTGELDGGGSFYELRLASGARVAPAVELAAFTGTCAFDGDAFLITRPNAVVRIAPDGTAGPPISITGIDECAATSAVTWVITGGSDEPIVGRRIARGGGVLDPDARMILDDSYFFVAAARASEAVVISQDRDDRRTFVVLADDGTATAVPLAIDVAFSRPTRLIGERAGYLLILESTGTSVVHGVRLAPDGTVLGAPFVLLDHAAGNTLVAVRTGDATTVVFDELPHGGEAPRIDAIRIADGAPPSEPTTIETTTGEAYTVDCGCQAGHGVGWLAGLVLLGLCRSRSRCRRSRSPTS
ncbi:MAG TPA: hypothetical protein VIU61_14720 [Kofleriaceae bacterium]